MFATNWHTPKPYRCLNRSKADLLFSTFVADRKCQIGEYRLFMLFKSLIFFFRFFECLNAFDCIGKTKNITCRVLQFVFVNTRLFAGKTFEYKHFNAFTVFWIGMHVLSTNLKNKVFESYLKYLLYMLYIYICRYVCICF